jgi:predicted GNAT family acetyltransferase
MIGRGMSYPLSRPERVILELSLMNNFSDGDGFNEVDSKQVPQWLAQRGLAQEVWLQWVAKLHTEVLPNGPVCGNCGYCLALLSVIGCPCWYSKLGNYHDHVRRWTDDFNAQVLRPLNMFAATQSAVYTENRVADNPNHFRKELSWLTIATTPEEIAELQQEAHAWRFDFQVRRHVHHVCNVNHACLHCRYCHDHFHCYLP